MRRISFSHFWLAASLGLVGWSAVGCGGDFGLPLAAAANYVDTVDLYALRGTPIITPSAFDIVTGLAARTDRGEIFDFAFDIDSTGVPVLLPAGVLGLAPQAGLLPSKDSFDEIDRAPTDEYVVDSVLTVAVGDVFVGRSRNSTNFCGYLGSIPRYGKFHVLGLDIQQRTITLELLVDVNCGYRNLEPGIPSS